MEIFMLGALFIIMAFTGFCCVQIYRIGKFSDTLREIISAQGEAARISISKDPFDPSWRRHQNLNVTASYREFEKIKNLLNFDYHSMVVYNDVDKAKK